MTRALRRIVIAIVITVALFAAAELAVRLAMPNVNLQGTDHDLFAERVWGPSVGMRANASGSCFGTDVAIDASGCRTIGAPASATRRWLVLGDSVAFGVGVASAETFVRQAASARARRAYHARSDPRPLCVELPRRAREGARERATAGARARVLVPERRRGLPRRPAATGCRPDGVASCELGTLRRGEVVG